MPQLSCPLSLLSTDERLSKVHFTWDLERLEVSQALSLCIKLALFFSVCSGSWERLQMILSGLGKVHCLLACSLWCLLHFLLYLPFAMYLCLFSYFNNLSLWSVNGHINKRERSFLNKYDRWDFALLNFYIFLFLIEWHKYSCIT